MAEGADYLEEKKNLIRAISKVMNFHDLALPDSFSPRENFKQKCVEKKHCIYPRCEVRKSL